MHVRVALGVPSFLLHSSGLLIMDQLQVALCREIKSGYTIHSIASGDTVDRRRPDGLRSGMQGAQSKGKELEILHLRISQVAIWTARITLGMKLLWLALSPALKYLKLTADHHEAEGRG